jgi:hypothetical protein
MSVELPEQYWMTIRCATAVHVIKDADCPQCRIAELEAALLGMIGAAKNYTVFQSPNGEHPALRVARAALGDRNE